MPIRPFQQGDEQAQLQIYNSAAGALPRFKPASLVEIQRRTSAADFDAGSRLFALDDQNKPVGYCSFQSNGRIGYPWCLAGHTGAADELFARTLDVMRQRGLTKIFTAYRSDWPNITDFFLKHGFAKAREMVNFVLAFENMPTSSARGASQFAAATPADAESIFALDPSVFRVNSPEGLRKALWQNPWITKDAVYVMRSGGAIVGAATFIVNNSFADPRAVDANMPCFRLSAFGTEGMTTKRIRGLFSFVARPDKNLPAIGMDLLTHAADRLRDDDEVVSYAAQVASDAPALHAFYQRLFERQGSFPVFERDLAVN
jgi:hypothetical protein